jgi:hypothetical protein
MNLQYLQYQMLLKSRFYSSQIVAACIRLKYKLTRRIYRRNLVIKNTEIIMVRETAIFIIKNSVTPNIKQIISKMR